MYNWTLFFLFFGLFVCFCLFETGSRYAAQAGLELTFVAQAGLELAPILLPQPPKCWDYRREPPHPVLVVGTAWRQRGMQYRGSSQAGT